LYSTGDLFLNSAKFSFLFNVKFVKGSKASFLILIDVFFKLSWVCYVYHELHFLTSSIGELQPVNYNLLAIKFCKNSKSILDPKLTLRYLVKHSFKILCQFFWFQLAFQFARKWNWLCCFNCLFRFDLPHSHSHSLIFTSATTLIVGERKWQKNVKK
jgi:hypothetical protein